MISSLNSQRPFIPNMMYQHYQTGSTGKRVADAYKNVLKITEQQSSKLSPQTAIGQNIDYLVKD